MTITPLPTTPADDCRLEGPCGFCATLTPSARAALAETLATDVAGARPVEQPGRPEHLLRWDDAVSEQAGLLESSTLALTGASDPMSPWRAACRDFVAIEIAKTVGLVVAAPAGVHVIRAGAALTAARTALAESLVTEAVAR